MNDATPQPIFLKDYLPPAHLLETVKLTFDIREGVTEVSAELQFQRNPAALPGPLELFINGPEIVELALDGNSLSAADYRIDGERLTLDVERERFLLRAVTRIHPEQNTALEGLYKSSGNYCTQCEAEGFRRITCFPDRPDVMAIYTTTIIADRLRYPVLLSNGNLVDQGDMGEGRHYATWNDPFPKPSYLFALVAGDLARVAGTFTTCSGREVALHFYVQHGNESKCDHALQSLKRAMRWDEERYGREYDLDIYMVVAVDDFNMGAMENKGLNVFNSRFVLARPETATDTDFVNIEGVIGHEYFHNWSGNRVTCRDWFQLSLKEGFTVFRDQQFTADMTSRAVKRIDDVTLLRSRQFVEDSGPLAHPIRPASYIEINNFYTLTVYEKGAEVVRMLHTLLGEVGFRRGSDLYFTRHDGQAVTTDDFVSAMEEANGVDLGRFRRWYDQAGTPELEVASDYDADRQRYTLRVRQMTPPTAGQAEKLPLPIPLRLALLDANGREMPLRLGDETTAGGGERVVVIEEAEQAFVFEAIAQRPVPSLLRDFSAPVKLRYTRDSGEQAFLMAHDSDPFNRWEAGQQLAIALLRERFDGAISGDETAFSAAFARLLADAELDDALKAEALTLPSEVYLAEFMEAIDPETIYQARLALRQRLANEHGSAIAESYRLLSAATEFKLDAAAMGRRRLANTLLGYLACGDSEVGNALAWQQYRQAHNMTDSLAALQALVHNGLESAEEALADFYARWHHDPLVLDKWFTIQATNPVDGGVERVRQLTHHPDFHLRNPNRARSILAGFGMANGRQFHRADGAGYRLLAEFIADLDELNPQVAARMFSPFTTWRRYRGELAELMHAELERLAARSSLSRDLFEVVKRALEG